MKKIEKAAILKIMEPLKSVAGILFSPDRTSVLLIQRRDVPVWVLPGGGIDAGESAEEAMVREILEETGITVKVERWIGDYLPINRLAKRTFLYECTPLSGAPKISEETRGVAYFPLHQLPPLPPPYLEWIQDAAAKRPPLQKKLTSVNYRTLGKYLLHHPILVLRFLLARLGFPINS